MRPIIPGLVAALLLASACTPKPSEPVRDPSITYGIPTPSSSPSSPTPSPAPSRSASPSTEDLVRQTQAAYKVAFDEFERLSRAGGADQPSAKLLEVTEGKYLEKIMTLLKDQKTTGFRVEGRPAATKSESAPGYTSFGSDPSLTLFICEDRRGVTLVERDGRRKPGSLSQGYIYAKRVAGRVKLVDIGTEGADECA